MKNSLLDSMNPSLVMINGHEVCTEEAAMSFEELSDEEFQTFVGMTELEIIERIYTDPKFGYNYL